MSMAADDVRPAYYCAAEVMRHRQRAGQPIPHWLSRHFDQLDAKIRASESGHESDRAAGQLDDEKLITAREAANIVGRSKRQVQRLAADLDGQIVGGRWLFQLNTVTEYAEERGRGV